MLTIKDILKNKVKVVKSTFQEQDIFIKEFTPKIRQDFIEAANFSEQQYVVIYNCLCNEDGSKLFSEEEKEELKELKPEYIDELFTVIMKNATGVSDKETAGN